MISIVIPVYNEERYLADTLNHLQTLQGDYEVIVVDGGSTDRTTDLTGSYPDIKLLSAQKGRASQMNAGAHAALGEWLLFLHADTLLPDDALTRLNAFENSPHIQAGGFRQQFSGNDWRLRLVSWLHNFRYKRTKVIYGDQAMFVRKALFNRLDGFPECQHLEDIRFSELLINETQPIMMEQYVITHARKFLRMGIWRSLARVIGIQLCYELRIPFMPWRFFQDIR